MASGAEMTRKPTRFEYESIEVFGDYVFSRVEFPTWDAALECFERNKLGSVPNGGAGRIRVNCRTVKVFRNPCEND
jgi:hypothetical protein